MSSESPPSGWIEEDVKIRLQAKCSECGYVLSRYENLKAESLTTGNTTQSASYWLKCMRGQFKEELSRRGWEIPYEKHEDGKAVVHVVMCGRCIAQRKDAR